MNLNTLKSGYWVVANNTLLCCYNTLEEAEEHIKCSDCDTTSWSIKHIIFKCETVKTY